MRFFYNAPQGPEARGVTGYKGFFYHFLEMDTGHRFGTTELSTVDTALLVAGMLFAARYFDQDHPDEAEIRQLAEAVYAAGGMALGPALRRRLHHHGLASRDRLHRTPVGRLQRGHAGDPDGPGQPDPSGRARSLDHLVLHL